MARYSGGARASGAGSSTLPSGSIYAVANRAPCVREVGWFNTTATATAHFLTRLTTAGTQGANITEDPDDVESAAVTATVVNTHSSTGPTLGNDMGYRAPIGAAIGAGVIFTFGDRGKRIPQGTGNGVGIITVSGVTAQIVDFTSNMPSRMRCVACPWSSAPIVS